MIILNITNPFNGLTKQLNVSKFTGIEIKKIYNFYTSKKWEVKTILPF